MGKKENKGGVKVIIKRRSRETQETVVKEKLFKTFEKTYKHKNEYSLQSALETALELFISGITLRRRERYRESNTIYD